MVTNLDLKLLSLFLPALLLLFLLSLGAGMESDSLDFNSTNGEELITSHQPQDLDIVSMLSKVAATTYGTRAETTRGLDMEKVSLDSTMAANDYMDSATAVSDEGLHPVDMPSSLSNYYTATATTTIAGRLNIDKILSDTTMNQYITTAAMTTSAGGESIRSGYTTQRKVGPHRTTNEYTASSDRALSGSTSDKPWNPTITFSLPEKDSSTAATEFATDVTETSHDSKESTPTVTNPTDINGTTPTVTNPADNNGTTPTVTNPADINGTTHIVTNPTETEPFLTTAEPEVDECQRALSCLPFSQCINLYESFTCECELGFYYSQSQGCVSARTFPGQLILQSMKFEERMRNRSTMEFSKVQVMVETAFKTVLESMDGYLSTVVKELKPGSVEVSILNYFSLSSNVIEEDVQLSVECFLQKCEAFLHEYEILNAGAVYHGRSLCHLEVCDPNTTTCSFHEGIVECHCLDGYFKYSAMDRSCRACGSGLQLKDGHCVRCQFGFTGFNCNEWFLLALVVVAGTGGLILLSLFIAVIVLSCRRRKPLEKPTLFFKNDNFGISPSNVVPKLPRVRPPWMVETIELRENGSENDLLQIDSEQFSPISVHSLPSDGKLSSFAGPENVENPYGKQGQQNPAFFTED